MSFADLVDQVIAFINTVIPILGGIALVLFLVSVVRYILKAGDAHGKSEEQKAMLWGLVALFVLFSIWGILHVLEDLIPSYNFLDAGSGGGGGNERNLN